MRILFFTTILSVLNILVPWSQDLRAANDQLDIQSYKHKGCILDPTENPLAPNLHYPPDYAHIGVPITFWYREARREATLELARCQEVIRSQTTACDLAIDYPAYLPSESRTECNAQYAKEVSLCRAHYAAKIQDCDALKSPLSRNPPTQDVKTAERPHSSWEELEPSSTLTPGWGRTKTQGGV